MRRNGFRVVGLLLLGCMPAVAQDQPPLDLRTENEMLRRERDAFESRLRQVQEQLDDARRSASSARLEIDALELRCRKLQDELRERQLDQPARLQNSAPAPAAPVALKANAVRGKITAMSANLRTMQISIGQDAGLKEGQVLDVFRMVSQDGPLYLGTIRLMRIDANAALGLFERVSTLDRAPKIGDEVSNELMVK